ncbi:MAG TPA: methyltransferase domain-containing protein [Marmoricola sp.]
MVDQFDEQLETWQEHTRTPWARIRYAVVAEVLRRQTAELGERLRVLDVGGGDGMDALPLARAGHEVTIVDPSTSWLREAARRAASDGVAITTVEGGLDDLPEGEWDLTLCHFVLRYRDADHADVAALARRVRPGGRLSIMDVNPAGLVLRALVEAGPEAASAQLSAERAKVVTFDSDARKVDAEDVRALAEAAGLHLVGRYANRIANDLVADNTAKHDPAFFDRLLELELALCDREPFNRIGNAWQLVFEMVRQESP